MSLRIAAEGAGRNDHLHGDEGTTDLDPFMAEALESVVETITLFGQYPQPRKGRFERIQFDLQEWMTEHYDPADLANLAMCAVINFGSCFDDRRLKESASLEQRLKDELRDSEIVREKAQELADDAREDV